MRRSARPYSNPDAGIVSCFQGFAILDCRLGKRPLTYGCTFRSLPFGSNFNGISGVLSRKEVLQVPQVAKLAFSSVAA